MKFKPFYNAISLVDDADELRRLAAENGYLFFRGLLSADLINRARVSALRACRAVGWLAFGGNLMDGVAAPGIQAGEYSDPAYLELSQQVASSAEFAEIRDHPAIIGVLEKLFDGPVLSRQGDVCR